MKKITLYLHILTLLLITACSNDDIAVPTPPTGEEGQECTLTFTVNVPDMTNASRALTGDASGIKTLKLLVFDGAEKNYLYERTATLSKQTSNGGTYSVKMVTSSEPRIVHFVATHAESLDVPYQVSEFAVVSQLYSEDNDAYWQRVEVPSITITKNGDTETVTALNITDNPVTLVRNVARITLKSSAPDFVVDGFAIVNAPSKGSIAPYFLTPDANGNNFPNYVVSNTTTNGVGVTSAIDSYNRLTGDGYIGVPYPIGSTLSEVPAAEDFPASNVQYMYERTQEGNNAFLVVRRKMSNNSYRYYKIDILKTQSDGLQAYYKILRNFSYDITITDIDDGADGFETPEAAANSSAADNNLAIAEELRDLTNIAYDKERLFVSKTEVVCTQGEFLSFKFKYYNTDGELDNDAVSFVFDTNYGGSGLVTNATSKSQCTIPAGTDDDDFATISIPVTGFVDRPNYKQQKVTVKGTGILSREVNMILVKPYENTVGCSEEQQSPIAVPPPTAPVPVIPFTVGSSVYVYFSMPANLPESIFPLSFILAPEVHSITPNGANMPVVSLLNHENSTMQGLKYGFEKVVTWEEYQASVNTGMVVECPFKTSLSESATKIYVYNEYFDVKDTYFMNPKAFKNLNLVGANRYGVGQVVTINFSMYNSLDPVTITVTEGNQSTTIPYTPTEMGNQSVTYKTKTWNSQISVKLEANGYDSVSASGGTRNKLFVRLTVNSNTNNINNGTYKVYAYSDKNYNNLLVSATKSEWENGVEITYNNLQQNATIYFRGQTGTDRWGNATFDYYAPKDSRTITQILSGTNINIG